MPGILLLRRILERVLAHELPFAWVTAESVYGADYALRRFLLEHHSPFVLAVAPNHQVRLGWQEGCASIRLDEWLTRQGRGRWSRISAGWGSKGPRWFDWTWWKLEIDVPDGWQAWVVVRRSSSDPTDRLFHLVCAPVKTTLHQIVQVADQRWNVEEAIERSKAECGLDQYEVRSWTGWYRHITLALIAHFCATLMTDQANAEPEKKPGNPDAARAICPASSAEEDWPATDPLHAARSAPLDLGAGHSSADAIKLWLKCAIIPGVWRSIRRNSNCRTNLPYPDAQLIDLNCRVCTLHPCFSSADLSSFSILYLFRPFLPRVSGLFTYADQPGRWIFSAVGPRSGMLSCLRDESSGYQSTG